VVIKSVDGFNFNFDKSNLLSASYIERKVDFKQVWEKKK